MFFNNQKIKGFTQTQKSLVSGFTLVELLVVISIAILIMTSLAVEQKQWGDRLALNTQTYELALEIRQAQIYSLGVRGDTSGSETDKFNLGYGVYIGGGFSQYTYFADRNNDQQYNPGEELETKTLTNGITISKFCGYDSGGVERCSDAGNLDAIFITFLRPNPKANIFMMKSGVRSATVNPPAKIYLTSPEGANAYVIVQSNGQVSISQ